MKISKLVAGVLIAGFVIAGVGILKAVILKKPLMSSVVRPGARAKGEPAAPIRVIEYTDFQCPACSRAALDLKEMLQQYPGKIYVQLKYFPLPMHPFARRAAIYAECAADQGKFWPFHDVLYKSQSSWSKMTAVDPYFSEMAVSLGIDGVRLSACVNGGSMEARVQKDVEDGRSLGVHSTPTFFINGKMVVGGYQFKEEIRRILNSNAP